MENQPPVANPPEEKKNVVVIELPAPEGWRKQFIPPKAGTPRRKDVLFISPTGEEIKSKRQLELYMKSHPGGPSTSEFDWGTGDTPRRSSRLTDKSKAVESPESETPKKKQRKSGLKKVGKGKEEDSDGDVEVIEMIEEKEVATEGAKGSVDVAMEDAKDIGDKGEVVIEAATDKENVKDTDQNTNEGEEVKEAALADEENVKDTEQKSEDKVDDTLVDAPENQETADKAFDTKEEGSETKSVQTPVVEDNNKEAEKGADPKDTSQLLMPSKASSSDQGAESVKEAVPEVADSQAENNETEKEPEAPAELPESSEVPPSEQEAENLTEAVHEVADAKVEESKIAENVNDGVSEVADPKVEESKNAEIGQEEHQNKEASEIAVSCM